MRPVKIDPSDEALALKLASAKLLEIKTDPRDEQDRHQFREE